MDGGVVLSSSNGLEKYPKLRFKGFSEPWKSVRIGEIYAERSERGAEDMELLSVTMNDGVKMRSDIEGKDNSSEDKSNYKIVRAGDMVYNSMRMWQGANGISPWDGIVSPAYTVLKPRIPLSNGFFAALFKTHRLINEFRKNSQGMTSDTWNLKYPQIETIKTCIPALAEQEKIAVFLIALDQRIEKQRTLVEHLKKYKRGVSEQLFEQIKSKSAQHVFSSVFVLLQNNTFSRELLTNDETEIQNIHYGDVLIKYGSCVNIDRDDVPYIKGDAPFDKFAPESYLMSGDIVIADTAEDYTVGKATEIINPSNKKILSGLHTIPCRPVMSFAPMFMGYYLNSQAFRNQIMPLIQGTKVSSIGKAQLMKTTVYIPPIDEQKRIADLLYSIDTKINLLSETADKMIQLKSAMLQQLFI